VAALVGNLKKSSTIEGSIVDVYTYNDYLEQVMYATTETPMLFSAMENYTDSENQLKKMDFISIPDFDGDGMENWGINAYRYVNKLSSLVLMLYVILFVLRLCVCVYGVCVCVCVCVCCDFSSSTTQREIHVVRRRFKIEIQRTVGNGDPKTLQPPVVRKFGDLCVVGLLVVERRIRQIFPVLRDGNGKSGCNLFFELRSYVVCIYCVIFFFLGEPGLAVE
jgi:hypothetical protein